MELEMIHKAQGEEVKYWGEGLRRHLLQVEHDGREGLLENLQDLPALLQAEGGEGRGGPRSINGAAGLLHSRLQDPVAACDKGHRVT